MAGLALWGAAAAPDAGAVAESTAAPEALHPSPFLAVAEGARWVVVGDAASTAPVDRHCYAASLVVQRALVGDDAPGAELRIAWEELARVESPRVRDGARLVVALDPLPGQSLWRRRFPDGDVRVIAGRGAGVGMAPDGPALESLSRFLAVPAETRNGADGVAALASLAVTARPRLALAALERIDEVPALAEQLSAPAGRDLGALAADPTAPPAVRVRVLRLVGDNALVALRPTVLRVVTVGSPLEAEARAALARLDGSIPAADVAALLARPDPALRALAVRYARGTPSEAEVAVRIRDDPAPDVRAAAVRAWIEWKREAGFDAVQPALFDPVPRVRGAAGEALGSLGEPVVPRLVALADARTGADAAGPLWALRRTGPAGERALFEIAATHPDPGVRKLASLIAGRPLHDH